MTTVPSVYELSCAEGYEWLLPVNDADFDRLRFDGQPRAHSWHPIQMRRLRTSHDGRPLEPGDFPGCSGSDMLFLSRRAKDVLEAQLAHHGELLPLACKDGEFWALNVTRLVDALDEDHSELLRASDTGEILAIWKHAFRPLALEGAQVFKLRQMPCGLIYVTDPIVSMIRESGLEGVEIAQIWGPD